VLLDLLVSLLGREEVVNSSHSRKAAMVIKEIAAKILPNGGACVAQLASEAGTVAKSPRLINLGQAARMD